MPEEGLEAGGVGTVVHAYAEGGALEIEVTTLTGNTAAVVTVDASRVRPVAGREMTHARQLLPC